MQRGRKVREGKIEGGKERGKEGERQKRKAEEDIEEEQLIQNEQMSWFIIIGFEKMSRIHRGLTETGNNPKMTLSKKQGSCLVL